MFNTLLESKHRRQRNIGSTIVSALTHLGLVALAVYTTQQVSQAEEAPEEVPNFAEIKPKEEVPKPTEVPPQATEKIEKLKGFQTLDAPINIPTSLPDIDLFARPTDERNYTGIGNAGGVFDGTLKKPNSDTSTTHFMFEVDKVARAGAGNAAPKYPNILRQTNKTGFVRAQFVIDTTGLADMSTFKVVESSHQLFSDEVKKALMKYKFIPAEMNGQKVRMVAEQLFEFKLDGSGGTMQY